MVNFRPLTSEDALMVLEWRNSDAVAPFMFRSDPIPIDEHQLWFSKILSDTDTCIYRIMEDAGVPVGFMSLTEINYTSGTCVWGGYLAPNVRRGVGLGKALLHLSALIAFEQFKMNQIVVEVIIGNDAAKGLYESVGFKIQKTIHKQAQSKFGPLTVLVMTLQRNSWDNTRQRLEEYFVDMGLII